MPFTSSEERLTAGKTPRETAMSSREIRAKWDAKLREESVFSARTTHKAYVDAIKKRLVEVIGGTLRPEEAERRLRETLRDIGYSPERGFGDGKVPPARAGDMRDLSSSRRIQLIIDTNVKRARSMGQVAASENPTVLLAIPAWRLTRTGARKKPRGNWRERWAAAGAACGWNGALKNTMAALKSSPIWEKLGDGEGGFTDAIGSPFPPFAFGSGMAWVGVGRREWQRLCAQEGVPDGLEEVAREAESLAESRGSSSAAGPAQVVQRPQEIARRADARETPLYTPVWTERDKANDAIDDASEASRRAERAILRMLSETEQMAQEVDDVAVEQELRAAAAYFKRTASEVSSLRGRIGNYGRGVETQPAPRSAGEQASFDMAMSRYAAGAVRTHRRVSELERSAARRFAVVKELAAQG